MYRFSKPVATLASTAVSLFSHFSVCTAEPIRITVGPDVIFGGSIDGNPAGSVGSATIDAHACHPCELGGTTSFAGSLGGTFFGVLQSTGRTFELGFHNGCVPEPDADCSDRSASPANY